MFNLLKIDAMKTNEKQDVKKLIELGLTKDDLQRLYLSKDFINYLLELTKKLNVKAIKASYIDDLPIGSRFLFQSHQGLNTLTHKLGRNGYINTTYPIRYRNEQNIELTSRVNSEVIAFL